MVSVSLVSFALVLCAIWDPRRTETANVTQHKLTEVDLKILRDRIGYNTVVSSFAFRLPLCKLAASATSTTRHEIISILDIHTLSDTKTCFSSLFPALSSLLESDLTMLNKIYVNYTSEIDNNFIMKSSPYGVTVSKIGFDFQKAAVDYVNREFSSKTYMRIRDVLDINDIDKHSSILIVNGFHYKGTWEDVFASPMVRHMHFRSGNKTLQIEMMHAVTQCSYMDDPDARYKAISFHLSQRDIYITFVLPYANSSIARLLDTMSKTPNFLAQVNSRTEWKFVAIQLPKFKIKTTLDWTPYLKQIGLNLTLNMKNTELNGILRTQNTEGNMYVSKAKQKLFIEIDEGRPTHNIMTHAEMPMVRDEVGQNMPKSPPVGIKEFAVNGPFYFAVTIIVRPNERSNKPNPRKPKDQVRRFQLFNGIYYGPQE